MGSANAPAIGIGPAGERWPERPDNDSFQRAPLDDQTANHRFIPDPHAAARRNIDHPRRVTIELVRLHQTDALSSMISAHDSRVISGRKCGDNRRFDRIGRSQAARLDFGHLRAGLPVIVGGNHSA